MRKRALDSSFLQERLDQTNNDLKDGVRREVQRLRRLGLPIYLGNNGNVVAMPPNPPTARNGS